jgi:hypothetical protein
MAREEASTKCQRWCGAAHRTEVHVDVDLVVDVDLDIDGDVNMAGER